ncbi:MAG: MraY family glycosyltransferase [Planctomycetota bacterium]
MDLPSEFDAATAVWLLLAGLPPLLLAWLATHVVRRRAPSWGLVDMPAARKVHTTPTPLGGGLAIAFALLVTFAAGELAVRLLLAMPAWQTALPGIVRVHLPGLASQSAALWVLLGGAALLSLLGLADDRRGLPWQMRLCVQFAVAAAVVSLQGLKLTAFIGVPAITWLLSVFWIVFLINSFNMLDNMDGLSSGVAAIAAATLAAVTLLAPDPETQRPQLFVSGYIVVLLGALLGFLWHNRPPARIFMGDAGSYFIGFYIATATLAATYAGYQSPRRHAVLAPVLVMAVPLYDMSSVILIRLLEGRSPFQADKCHLSHRLVDLGLTKVQAVLTIYLLTFTCGLAALLLHRVDTLGAVLVVMTVLCVLSLIAILESSARRKFRERSATAEKRP